MTSYDEKMRHEEKKLYDEAMGRMKELAQEVYSECCEMAERYDYEKDWVIAGFRECFTRATKEIKN